MDGTPIKPTQMKDESGGIGVILVIDAMSVDTWDEFPEEYIDYAWAFAL